MFTQFFSYNNSAVFILFGLHYLYDLLHQGNRMCVVSCARTYLKNTPSGARDPAENSTQNELSGAT